MWRFPALQLVLSLTPMGFGATIMLVTIVQASPDNPDLMTMMTGLALVAGGFVMRLTLTLLKQAYNNQAVTAIATVQIRDHLWATIPKAKR